MKTITETPAAWNAALEKTLADFELWGGWIQSASDVPARTAFFNTPKSNAELLHMVIGGDKTSDDSYYAMLVLRLRFTEEHKDLIALEAAKIAEGMQNE